MISLLFLLVLLAPVAYIALRRRVLLAAAFFFIFPLTYRAIDITYLDLFGPIYASELGRYVGGNDAAPMFIYAALCLIIPLLWVFRAGGAAARLKLRQRAPWQLYHRTVSNGAFFALAAIALGLYASMAMTGTIPLLQGMDRLEYNLVAGPFHNIAYELTFLMSFALGAFTVLPRLNGEDYDMRFVAILAALVLYWVLTGNRFSIFFTLFSFYFMPLAAVIIAREARLISELGPHHVIQRLLASRVVRTFGIGFAVMCVAGLVLNSYYNVRNYRDPIQQIEERVLLQPVQLWSTTWERVDFSQVHVSLDRAAMDQIFLNPIDPTRNTTIQYLITTQLGYFRSVELTRLGQQYNGGYPEVHFELLSPWVSIFTLPLMGIITALMLRLCIMMLYRNMILSAIACIYVFFGFCLHYAGGSVTFFLAPTYWLKIFALVVAVLWEQQFMQRRARRASNEAEASRASPRRGRPLGVRS